MNINEIFNLDNNYEEDDSIILIEEDYNDLCFYLYYLDDVFAIETSPYRVREN